ncbi:uncharacterized protein [Diadema setosum]|uniref:uncharacterized protein n=1 Tax=Diadema setosum TaxID=31175 RepID=UPI003B3A36AC
MEPHHVTLSAILLILSVLLAVTSASFPSEAEQEPSQMSERFMTDTDLTLEIRALKRLLGNIMSVNSNPDSAESYPMTFEKRNRSGRKLRFCIDVIRNTWRLCRSSRSN